MIQRKNPRLLYFDYSSSRYYFVTICTVDRRCLFGKIHLTEENGKMVLNRNGSIVLRHIQELSQRYDTVRVDHYTIMPNHLHMILELDNHNTVTLSQIIGLFKSGVSRELGFSVWQRSFHDHIIRSEKDYKAIWYYVDNNPAKWAMDKYFLSE